MGRSLEQAQLPHIQLAQVQPNADTSQIREATSSDNSPTTNRRTLSTSLTPRSSYLGGYPI